MIWLAFFYGVVVVVGVFFMALKIILNAAEVLHVDLIELVTRDLSRQVFSERVEHAYWQQQQLIKIRLLRLLEVAGYRKKDPEDMQEIEALLTDWDSELLVAKDRSIEIHPPLTEESQDGYDVIFFTENDPDLGQVNVRRIASEIVSISKAYHRLGFFF